MAELRWKKQASWDLSRQEQLVWTAQGSGVEYRITRSGTADKPVWTLYTRQPDGTEEAWFDGVRLRAVKRLAESMEEDQDG